MLQEKYMLIAKNAGYKKLTPFQEKVIPAALNNRHLIAETMDGCGKNPGIVISALLLTETYAAIPGLKSIIIASSPVSVKKITGLIKKFYSRKLTKLQALASGTGSNIKNEYRLMHLKQPDIFIGTAESIIDHIRRENIDFNSIQNCIIEDSDVKDVSGFEKDVEYIFSKMDGKQNFLVFTSKKEHKYSFYNLFKKPALIQRSDYSSPPANPGPKNLKEIKKAQMHNKNDDEYTSAAILSIIKDLKENEEPHRMDYLKKIIKKNVSFFMRGYFTAYLLNQYLKKPGHITDRKKRAAPQGASASGSGMENKTLFINTGKNKGLFPRDLSGLMLSLKNIEKSDIKNIKVLDNYSFAEVTAQKADLIINQLNLKTYKGKKINADYARSS